MHLFCLPTLFTAAVYNCLFYNFLIPFLKKKCLFYWCNTFKVHARSLMKKKVISTSGTPCFWKIIEDYFSQITKGQGCLPCLCAQWQHSHQGAGTTGDCTWWCLSFGIYDSVPSKWEMVLADLRKCYCTAKWRQSSKCSQVILFKNEPFNCLNLK